MSIKTLIEEANKYDKREWPFSSAYTWKKIITVEPTSFRLLQYADQLRLSGNYESAHKIINQIKIEEIPDDYKYQYYLELGKLLEDQYQIDSAINAYKKCIKFDTNSTIPFVFLGSLLSRKGDLQEAEKIFIKGKNKEGDLDEIYYNLSTIYARQKKFDKAIKAMEKCIEIDKLFPNAETLLNDIKNLKQRM